MVEVLWGCVRASVRRRWMGAGMGIRPVGVGGVVVEVEGSEGGISLFGGLSGGGLVEDREGWGVDARDGMWVRMFWCNRLRSVELSFRSRAFCLSSSWMYSVALARMVALLHFGPLFGFPPSSSEPSESLGPSLVAVGCLRACRRTGTLSRKAEILSFRFDRYLFSITLWEVFLSCGGFGFPLLFSFVPMLFLFLLWGGDGNGFTKLTGGE